MNEIVLVKPTLELKDQILDYKNEHILHGESELHGAALLDKMNFDDWLCAFRS